MYYSRSQKRDHQMPRRWKNKLVQSDDVESSHLTITWGSISSWPKSKLNLGGGASISSWHCWVGGSLITPVTDRRGWLPPKKPDSVPLHVGTTCISPETPKMSDANFPPLQLRMVCIFQGPVGFWERWCSFRRDRCIRETPSLTFCS